MTARWRGLSPWSRLVLVWAPFVIGCQVLWALYPEGHLQGTPPVAAIVMVVLVCMGLGSVTGLFEHGLDGPDIPKALLITAILGLLAMYPSGNVVLGLVFAGVMCGSSWISAVQGIRKRDRERLGSLPRPPSPPPG